VKLLDPLHECGRKKVARFYREYVFMERGCGLAFVGVALESRLRSLGFTVVALGNDSFKENFRVFSNSRLAIVYLSIQGT
jgi:hypothetical protein